MSLPDSQLDEPDPRVCEEHGEAIPCRACWAEAREYKAECNREERHEPR